MHAHPSRFAARDWIIVCALGATQILAYGSTYYLPAVLAQPIADETGWSLPWIVGGFSIGMLASGLVSPMVGRSIEAYGGRPVLGCSACLMGIGLIGLGLSPTIALYCVAWLVTGIGMGAGLYEATFSTLGRLYGQRARLAITVVTLFGGFASTVCWPLSAFLVETVGWRATCFLYAGLQLTVSLFVFLRAVPPAIPHRSDAPASSSFSPALEQRAANSGRLFIVLAALLTMSAGITAMISVQLLAILQTRGVALAEAVALGALIGPSQVAARSLEMALGRRHHPVWTLVAAISLIAVGLIILSLDLPLAALAIILYGSGMGIESIARGTVPLALFGAAGYPALMGRLALPSLLAQAAAPFASALVLDQLGVPALMSAVMVMVVTNVALVLYLLAASNPARSA